MLVRGRVLATGIATAGLTLLAAGPATADSYQPRPPSAASVFAMTPARGGAPAMGVAASSRGGTYGGQTSDGDPIVLGLSRSRKALTRVVDQWNAPCASGMGYPSSGELRGQIAIDGKGRAAGGTSGNADLGGGLSGSRTERFALTVRGRSVSGSWQAHVDIVDTQSQAIRDSCDASFTFKATSSRRRVFGGATSQHTPVMLTRSSRGTKVSRIGLGWRAPCTPQGFFQIGDSFVNFPIKKGRFGDDFTDRENTQSGPFDFTYSLRGRLGATSGSGTFHGVVTHPGPSGSVTSCDSGPMTWKVASG
jgi:hypothetical protein